MTEDTAASRDLARRLLATEAEGGPEPFLTADALDRVCRKLHHQLERVVGELGVRAIVRHAVALTRAKFPFLAADPVSGDNEYLTGLRESLQGQDPAVATEAITSLLTNLLTLLQDMLGKNLTYVLLHEAWPNVEIPTGTND